MMRSDTLEEAREEIVNSEYLIRELEGRISVQKEVEEKAIKAQLSSDEMGVKLDQVRDLNRDLETKIQILEGEVNSSKFRIRVLEGELADKNTAIGALSQELDEAETKPKVEHRDWSDHPFVRPVEPPAPGDEKDDLTEIKGIGPAFQKKLNMLDINSFRQLSELDGESVERLAEIIEVFPERIHRDNWIGQATRLYMKKLGREV
jgi:predicted flap endonuclease-1-like 5' DNA nuclease